MKTDRRIIVKPTARELGVDQGEIFLDLQESPACLTAVPVAAGEASHA